MNKLNEEKLSVLHVLNRLLDLIEAEGMDNGYVKIQSLTAFTRSIALQCKLSKSLISTNEGNNSLKLLPKEQIRYQDLKIMFSSNSYITKKGSDDRDNNRRQKK